MLSSRAQTPLRRLMMASSHHRPSSSPSHSTTTSSTTTTTTTTSSFFQRPFTTTGPLLLAGPDPPTQSQDHKFVDGKIPVNDPKEPKQQPNVSATNTLPTSAIGAQDSALVESTEEGEEKRQMQAPNRRGTWARSQQERSKAMVGPRFEQTIMEFQPRPYSAMELIHKQPVRWTHERVVACDGGGGPLGHPRIFINVDKPQVCWCTYCGLPFAHEHNRALLEAKPQTTYPLKPTGDPAEVPESQRVTDEALGQR